MQTRKFITGSNETYNVTSEPYDYILVTFENDFQMGGSSFVKGQVYLLPGIFVYGLFNSAYVGKWKNTTEAAVMTALTLVGVSEITAAVEAESALGFLLGTIDVGLGVGDVALNIAFKNEVENIYPGLGDAWSKVAMCYGIGRLAGVGLDALYKKAYVESHLAQYDFRLSTNAHQTSEKLFSELEQSVPDLTPIVNGIKSDVANLKENIWVEGRTLSAEGVNMDFVVKAQDAGLDPYPPYLSLSFVEDVNMSVNSEFYCVETLEQSNPGGWMGITLFNTEVEARQGLAILPEFKGLDKTLVIRKYKVLRPIQARRGICGDLYSPSSGITYQGGESQFQILNGAHYNNWRSNFENLTDNVNPTIRGYIKILTK